jgi:hypothetical protein
MYNPHRVLSYPRLEAMIDLGVALWRWLTSHHGSRTTSGPALR